jgi:hypothetical protein
VAIVTGRRRFSSPSLAVAGRRIERDFGEAFAEFGATPVVVPVKLVRLLRVGEGVALSVDPHDIAGWEWWGYFEDELEIATRRRFSRDWRRVVSDEDAETWLRERAETYLKRLKDGHPT